MLHPQNAEVLGVGQHVARLDLKHVLRRERDADDAQLLPPAVDDRHDRVADVQLVGLHERLAGQHLVVAAQLPVAGRGAGRAGSAAAAASPAAK